MYSETSYTEWSPSRTGVNYDGMEVATTLANGRWVL